MTMLRVTSAIVAHAGGMSWDELLILAVPIVILGVLQLVGRRRNADSGGSGGSEGEGEPRPSPDANDAGS
jgi:hypothetical protein